jgi:cysteine desulfurase
MSRVYLDYASTTPVAQEVLDAMMPYFGAQCGNPSSVHAEGIQAREAVEQARGKIADLLACSPQEVIFTSGGSESDNLAILGAAWALEGERRHIVTSAIEHYAVLRVCQWLEQRGWEVAFVPVDRSGIVDPERIRTAIRRDTALVTVMHANNEVGSIQPIAEIGSVCRGMGVLFHTDAVQTVGHIPTRVDELNVDLLSLSAHKFYGPKGVGALFVRRGVHIAPLIHGGGHERGRRSGTENVAGIVGLGRAAELAWAEMSKEAGRQGALRDRLLQGIMAGVSETIVTGHPRNRLPNNASVIIRGVDGEAQLRRLDQAGIAASSGSACTSGSLEPSHVLLAMGFSPQAAFGSLRLTLGRHTTEDDIDYVIEFLPGIVEPIRAMTTADGLFECDCVEGECT